MINVQTHIDDSTIEVEEEKKEVEDSTEVANEEVTEQETVTPEPQDSTEENEGESKEAEPSPDENDATQKEQAANENVEAVVAEDTTQSAESDQSSQLVEVQTDTSESESEETSKSEETSEVVTDDSETSETASEEDTPASEPDTDTPKVTSEDTQHTADTDNTEVTSEETPSTAEIQEETIEDQSAPMSQESLEEAYENSLKAFTDGEIVKGTVVEVSRDEVMIDIGFKSEGYIHSSEFEKDESDLPTVKVGDEIDVFIVHREDSEGQIKLSKIRADQTLVWDEITQAFDSGSPVEGQVTERIKGGLRVAIGTLRGFLPASQVELRPIQNLDQYIGETFQMKIISMNKKRHNIVLSRRAWLEAEMAEKREEVLRTLEVGQLIKGTVKNITAFGAFVDLGGVDGLLHKTDMAWKRIHHPSEIVEIGEEIEVQVIAIGKETDKISLGLKQKTDDPWENVEEKYAIGSKVSGTVVNIVNYGVFVQLEEAVEGLIHVSEMAWTRRNVAPSRIVSKGDEIEAIVLEISKEDKRISLGIKQLQPNPWELLEQKYPVGTKIEGRIRNLTNFGAFVEIEEGIDGLIHTSDLSWTDRGSNPQELLKEGDEVEVVVLQIDASERRVSLGLKQTQPDPWDTVPEKYKVGSVVRGQIVNLTSFGAFTKLEEGIDGLIHISEIADRRIERPEEVVSVGDELDVKVINLDPKGRRIGLSLKAAIADQERATAPPEEQQEGQRQQRQQRQRPIRQREQRPPKPIEEEETIMGALLKQEMGKNNVQNLINAQDAESQETTENTQETEVSEDTDTTTEVADDTENIDVPEETESAEDTATIESTDETESSEKETENPENKDTDPSEEKAENSENTEANDKPDVSEGKTEN